MHGLIVTGRHAGVVPPARHAVFRMTHLNGMVGHEPVHQPEVQRKLDALLRKRSSFRDLLPATKLELAPVSAEFVLRKKIGGEKIYPELSARGWSVGEIFHFELFFLNCMHPRRKEDDPLRHARDITEATTSNLRKWGYQI